MGLEKRMPVMHIRPAGGAADWPSRVLRLVVAGAALSGCARAGLLDALTPAGDYLRQGDIVYGAAPRQKLDIYRPRKADRRRTVLVFLYGGAWRSGIKTDYRFVAEALTRRGLTVVIPDYRLYPEVEFPAFVNDAALATRWVRDNAVMLGVDPDRIFLMGHSAGAHMATLLALDPRYLAAVDLRPRDVAGIVGIAGPYDSLPVAPAVKEVFAATADLTITQPIAFAGPDAPPMLLVHGTADTTVYPRNSERLAAKLRSAGAPVRLALHPGRGHLDILLGLSSVLGGNSRLMREIEEFLATSPVLVDRGLDLVESGAVTETYRGFRSTNESG
jgi:acetyl esterase/lipase